MRLGAGLKHCAAPFEPPESVDLMILYNKTYLLMALASAKNIGNLCYQYTLPVLSLWKGVL